MRELLVIVVLTGCGRFGFEDGPTHDAAADDATVDANPLTPICGTTDTDGDGIGDECDPSDAVPHQVALFESFEAMPAGWSTTGAGLWSSADDGLHVMYTDGSASSFVSPMTFDPPVTITIHYTIDMIDGGAGMPTISVVDAFDVPSQDSQKCGQAAPSRNTIGHELSGTTVDATSVAFPDSLVEGATYTTTFDHRAADMSCTSRVPAIGPAATVSVQHAPWRSSGSVGVRIRSIAATFHSLVVVTPK